MTINSLETEWCLLQQQFDSYERYSLLIKLLNVVLLSVAILFSKLTFVELVFISILWLQDAIWKTFQARIEARLLFIEQQIEHQEQQLAFQFNRQWAATRSNTFGLMIEYLGQAIRPTVAFPHAILWLISLLCLV